MEEDSSAAAAAPMEPEKRDDSETVAMLDSEFRTAGSSSGGGSGDGGDEVMMMEEDEEDNTGNDMNMTRFDDDDDSKLDINSVLSGNVDDDDEDDDDASHMEGVFGKNLSEIFDDNAKEDVATKHPPAAASASGIPPAVRPASSSHPSRPPLAPGRPATASALLKSNATNDISSGKRPATATAEADGKRLSVYLRVRPPVCADGKKGNEGSINTIDVITDKKSSTSLEQKPLPTTIRTYPPLNSNAAKVVRGGSSKLAMLSDLSSSNLKKNALSSKSLIDDGVPGVDPTAEVRGVKEYEYSGVFGTNATQSDVYNNVAAPLVEGLFPQSNSEGVLGESALLFTLGVTNAGKTHTVMGTGFESKADKKKMQKNDYAPDKDWGIIPRSLAHMLTRINSLNETNSSGGPQLTLYMSYLEIYNEQIFDLLPGKSDAPRRPCDGPPTLKLRESRRGRIFVRGLARHAVNSVQEGLGLAQTAKSNRHTASNNINANSSRSHSICQLEIAYAPISGGKRTAGMSDSNAESECETDDESVCSAGSRGISKQRKSTIIWIVDLAGSERSKRTRSHTRHQKEAALINASLMNLMRCLREMLIHQDKKRGGVVPFRESKLTHMFMNHLTGPAASRTSMIVNVNPAADDYDETQHVLSYAATARAVTVSAIDYNRKRREFAKESKVKLSPKKAQKALGKIVKKLSPKKRKGTLESSNPQAKRLRSSSHTTALSRSTRVTRAGASAAARKPPPMSAPAPKRGFQSGNGEVEKLREEKFILTDTVDDLRQQLADCENEVREEVVATMNEQLQDSKNWYENRIAQLVAELTALKSSGQGSVHGTETDRCQMLQEQIDECEEEMVRMREDHKKEVEELGSTHLQLNNELQAEQEKSKKLENEVGALRHTNTELQVSHDSLLAKYNALLASTQQKSQEEAAAATTQEKENPNAAESPSFRKLPRERVSDVASTAGIVDIVSPKKKRGAWFMRSPAKVGAGEEKKMSPTRSPLGKINKN